MVDVFARVSGELLVNSNVAGNQTQSVVTAQYNGSAHITWRDESGLGGDASGSAIKGQVLHADSSRFRGEFLINGTTAGAQYDPAAAQLSNGFNIVVWADDSGSGGDPSGSIKAQYLDSAGSKYRTEFLVNSITTGEQENPVVATRALGGFVVAWIDRGDPAAPVVKAQLYANNAVRVGSELSVSGITGTGIPDQPAIAPLAGGAFAIVWCNRGIDGADTTISGQLFDASGARGGSVFTVETGMAGGQAEPALVMLEGGRFVLVWTGMDESGDAGIRGQIFDAAGAAIGAEISVNTHHPGAQTQPAVAALKGGGFVISWTDGNGDGRDVKAQAFGADGIAIGDELRVNTQSAGEQWDSSIVTLTGGATVVSWTEQLAGGSTEIKAQYLQFASAAPIEGDDGSNTLTGTVQPDFLYGYGGDDFIRGGEGGDVIDGGADADDLSGEAGSDLVHGGAGDDLIEDRLVGNDQLNGDDGDDTIIVRRNNDPVHDHVVIAGGAGEDFISYVGGGSDLVIDAGADDDVIELGIGDVTGVITLGDGSDTVRLVEPAPGVFRAPTLRITDFAVGVAGDRLDFGAIAGNEPFLDDTLRLAQSGADVILHYRTTQGFIPLVTFQNRALADFTSDNFAGARLPGTWTIAASGVVTNVSQQVGDPAVLIAADNAHFVNADGGIVRAATPGNAAIVIDAAGVIVENAAGARISAADYTSGSVILGSSHGDIVRNFGVLDGYVRLGAGSDSFFEQVTAETNTSPHPVIELGEGDDSATFDVTGMTLLNDANVRGGNGSDTLTVDGIGAGVTLRLAGTSGIERLFLNAVAGGGSAQFARPNIAEIHLSPGLTYIVPDSIGSRAAFTGTASGTVYLNGGNLDVGMTTAFSQIIGGNDAETVTLAPRMFPPTAVPTPIDSVSLGGGDDSFVWNSYHSSPLAADGGAGSDTVRMGQDSALLSLSAFAGFETIDHILSNGYSGNTYRLTGIGASFERLLLDPVAKPATLELSGVTAPALEIGIGGSKLVILADSTVGAVADRILLDASASAAANQLDNRGSISGDVSLGEGADIFVNSGTVSGDVALGAGDDLYIAQAGGVVTGGIYGGAGNDIYTLFEGAESAVELAGEGIDGVRTALGSRADASPLYVLPTDVENFTGTLATGQGVRLNAGDNVASLGAGDDLVVASDGGNDRIGGGGGNDFLYFGGAFTSADAADGGAGFDTVGLVGSYTIAFQADDLTSIEKLAAYSSGDVAAPNAYSLTMNNANVVAGQQMMVVAQSLLANETFAFDGAAETDGRFNVRGGRGADTIATGAGADRIWGNTGPDSLTGGAGKDLFEYRAVNESATGARDTILDFAKGDQIFLDPIDANGNAGGNQAFRFIGATAFSGSAGELRAGAAAGTPNGWLVEGDVNGDGVADLSILVVATPGYQIGASDFWL